MCPRSVFGRGRAVVKARKEARRMPPGYPATPACGLWLRRWRHPGHLLARRGRARKTVAMTVR